jgi:hypothetical protein
MAVSNPLYKRLGGAWPERDVRGEQLRPKIMVEPFLALLRAFVTGEITQTEFSARIGDVSGVQQDDGSLLPVGLSTTEFQQAQDLAATVTSIATPGGTSALQVATRAEGKADRGMRLIKVREILMCLDIGALLTGYGPDDMAGTTTVAGGKLDVIRRDAP